MEGTARSEDEKNSETRPLASIGTRGVARIVDTLLLGVISAALFWISFGVLQGDSVGFSWTFTIATGLVFAGYEIVLTKIRGQTLGKMILRIRVVSHRDARLPGWGASVIRYGVPTLSSFLLEWATAWLYPSAQAWTFLFLPAFYLLAAFDPNRQGIHDKTARTIVVSVPRDPQSRPGPDPF